MNLNTSTTQRKSLRAVELGALLLTWNLVATADPVKLKGRWCPGVRSPPAG